MLYTIIIHPKPEEAQPSVSDLMLEAAYRDTYSIHGDTVADAPHSSHSFVAMSLCLARTINPSKLGARKLSSCQN